MARATRPHCLNCGRPLPKTTWYATKLADEPDPVTHLGQPVVAIVRRKPYATENRVGLSIWLGAYGRRGDNHFCGTECGYRYAARVAIVQDEWKAAHPTAPAA